MQRADREAVPAQRLVQDVHVALAVAEDQRVLHVLRADQPAQRLALVGLGHQGMRLGDGRRHRGGFGDGDLLGVLQEHVGQAADLRGDGGAEEQRLPVGGQQRDDALHIGDEPHVEHAVGLVDHQHAGVGEQDGAAVEHVHQPAGRGDQHVHAAHQDFLLVGHAFAADHQGVGELQVLAIFDEVFRHLQRQFAGRLQDQAARHAGAGAAAGQDVQHRQREARGLAGAGLRAAQQVAAHQDVGDGLFLDGRGGTVPLLGDRAHDRLRQAEFREA